MDAKNLQEAVKFVSALEHKFNTRIGSSPLNAEWWASSDNYSDEQKIEKALPQAEKIVA